MSQFIALSGINNLTLILTDKAQKVKNHASPLVGTCAVVLIGSKTWLSWSFTFIDFIQNPPSSFVTIINDLTKMKFASELVYNIFHRLIGGYINTLNSLEFSFCCQVYPNMCFTRDWAIKAKVTLVNQTFQTKNA